MSVRNLGELGINLQKIATRLMANQNLLKLLFYTDKDPLAQDDLNQDTIRDYVYNKLILVVPYIPADTRTDATSKVSLRVLNGVTLSNNSEFRKIHLSLEVFVPMTQWAIKNSNLRPFAIMGELQTTLNNKKINGLGQITGGDFSLEFLTEEMSCYSMDFWITEYE